MQKGRTVPDLTQRKYIVQKKIHNVLDPSGCKVTFFLKTLLMLSFMFVCQSGLLLLFTESEFSGRLEVS